MPREQQKNLNECQNKKIDTLIKKLIVLFASIAV